MWSVRGVVARLGHHGRPSAAREGSRPTQECLVAQGNFRWHRAQCQAGNLCILRGLAAYSCEGPREITVRPSRGKIWLVCHLASYIGTWSADCDARLRRLVSYSRCVKNYLRAGWVCDPLHDLTLRLCADAGFAGCAQMQKPAFGIHLAMMVAKSYFLLAAGSQRRAC